jgi:hypothetical protein
MHVGAAFVADGRRDLNGERNALGVDDHVVLRAEFSTFIRFAPVSRPPPFARTLDESAAAREGCVLDLAYVGLGVVEGGATTCGNLSRQTVSSCERVHADLACHRHRGSLVCRGVHPSFRFHPGAGCEAPHVSLDRRDGHELDDGCGRGRVTFRE